MADAKLTDLAAITATTNDDLVYVVDDPGGTPVSKKVALRHLPPQGNAFPGSPTTGDYFRRTDRGGLEYRYDGTRWLSVEIFTVQLTCFVTLNATATATAGRANHVWGGAYDIYVLDAEFLHVLSGTGNWTLDLQKVNTSGTSVTIATSGAFTTTSRTRLSVAVNAVVPTSDNITDFTLVATENSGTATLVVTAAAFTYRLVG